jgi:hypothetical protein
MNTTEVPRLKPAYSKLLVSVLMASLVVLALGLWKAPGASASTAYPPTDPCSTFSVSGGSLVPGSTVTASGSGFTGGQPGTLSLDSSAVGSFTTGGSGSFATPLTVPSDLSVGTHQVQVTVGAESCRLGLVVKSTTGTTTSSGSSAITKTGSSGLAFTGFAAITFATIGGLIVMAGLMFLLIGRRRRV